MAIESKQTIQDKLTDSAKRLSQVRQRQTTQRAIESQQEAEPRQPPAIDITRR